MWVAHQNRGFFGMDANIFRPERWLEANADRVSKTERCFIPFGSGSRMCIGKNISMLEISKVIPALLLNFEFTLQNASENGRLASNCNWFVKPETLCMSIKQGE